MEVGFQELEPNQEVLAPKRVTKQNQEVQILRNRIQNWNQEQNQ